jgi:hypothetical protein
VGDNASARIEPGSYLKLLRGLATHFRISTFGQLSRFALGRRGAPWYGAIFLDRFLADVFVRQWRRHRPDFASLFLNAAAHIQHHYMFSSAVYEGPNKNPDWYLAPGRDPLLDIYRVYDGVVRDLLALPGAPRLMLATGLHQDPYPTELFYYRLADHASFLTRLGVNFESVTPLMSRDFTVSFASAAACDEAARRDARSRRAGWRSRVQRRQSRRNPVRDAHVSQGNPARIRPIGKQPTALGFPPGRGLRRTQERRAQWNRLLHRHRSRAASARRPIPFVRTTRTRGRRAWPAGNGCQLRLRAGLVLVSI